MQTVVSFRMHSCFFECKWSKTFVACESFCGDSINSVYVSNNIVNLHQTCLEILFEFIKRTLQNLMFSAYYEHSVLHPHLQIVKKYCIIQDLINISLTYNIFLVSSNHDAQFKSRISPIAPVKISRCKLDKLGLKQTASFQPYQLIPTSLASGVYVSGKNSRWSGSSICCTSHRCSTALDAKSVFVPLQ